MWRGYADRPTSNRELKLFPSIRVLVLLNRSSLIVLHMKFLTLELSSRVHFYPDKSCTILMKNMYNGPGIAWEQEDEEGLEVFLPVCFFIIFFNLHQTFMDSLQWSIQIRKLNEEFYEDVHTEFQKYGELVNFKVCRNGSFHLKGNVYVHYRSLESSILAYQSINGRYFADSMRSCQHLKMESCHLCGTCSPGSACNFIHCFRNPGGDYEWADNDKPPPRFWIRIIWLFR
ncbi:hypothetical protein Bca101_069413 [Brassica carinata]